MKGLVNDDPEGLDVHRNTFGVGLQFGVLIGQINVAAHQVLERRVVHVLALQILEEPLETLGHAALVLHHDLGRDLLKFVEVVAAVELAPVVLVEVAPVARHEVDDLPREAEEYVGEENYHEEEIEETLGEDAVAPQRVQNDEGHDDDYRLEDDLLLRAVVHLVVRLDLAEARHVLNLLLRLHVRLAHVVDVRNGDLVVGARQVALRSVILQIPEHHRAVVVVYQVVHVENRERVHDSLPVLFELHEAR